MNALLSNLIMFGWWMILGGALCIAGNLTVCNDYLAQQVEQDVATSTLYPRQNLVERLGVNDE